MGKSEGGDVVLRRVLAAAFGAASPSRPLLTHHKVNKERIQHNLKKKGFPQNIAENRKRERRKQIKMKIEASGYHRHFLRMLGLSSRPKDSATVCCLASGKVGGWMGQFCK